MPPAKGQTKPLPPEKFRDLLQSALPQYSLELTDAPRERISRFLSELDIWRRRVNLTGRLTADELVSHTLESLVGAELLSPNSAVVDVGTGGGFPGVPLAVACPERAFTLIDGTAKKIRFVEESVAALDIRNVQVAHARAENYTGEKNFHAVVVRAVGSLADVLHNVSGLLAPGGRLLAMKGKLTDEEMRGIPRGWHPEVFELAVPGLDAERHLVVISRQRKG